MREGGELVREGSEPARFVAGEDDQYMRGRQKCYTGSVVGASLPTCGEGAGGGKEGGSP